MRIGLTVCACSGVSWGWRNPIRDNILSGHLKRDSCQYCGQVYCPPVFGLAYLAVLSVKRVD